MPEPKPRQLDGASPRPRVTRPGDALVASDAATLPGDRDQAQVAADLPAVVKAAIVHLVRQHAGERLSDAAHLDELTSHRAVMRDHLLDLALHLGEHLLGQPQSATFALDLSLRPRRQGLAFGRPNRVETLFPIPLNEPVIAYAVQDEQPFDARDMAVALVQQALALTAETALVLLSDARHTHDTAHLPLPAHERHQYTQQRTRIQPVRLCTPCSAIDQDRRRVEHTVVDATPDQEPVQARSRPGPPRSRRRPAPPGRAAARPAPASFRSTPSVGPYRLPRCDRC